MYTLLRFICYNTGPLQISGTRLSLTQDNVNTNEYLNRIRHCEYKVTVMQSNDKLDLYSVNTTLILACMYVPLWQCVPSWIRYSVYQVMSI